MNYFFSAYNNHVGVPPLHHTHKLHYLLWFAIFSIILSYRYFNLLPFSTQQSVDIYWMHSLQHPHVWGVCYWIPMLLILEQIKTSLENASDRRRAEFFPPTYPDRKCSVQQQVSRLILTLDRLGWSNPTRLNKVQLKHGKNQITCEITLILYSSTDLVWWTYRFCPVLHPIVTTLYSNKENTVDWFFDGSLSSVNRGVISVFF